MSLVSQAPTGFRRWLFRLPITLYRLRLGGVLGERFMLINHIGRKSGSVRQVVVEVVAHDTSADCYYAVSGWGYKSQWYQNLMAQPNITIQVGWRSLAVHAEQVPPTQGSEILSAYRQRHPRAARELGKVMAVDFDSRHDELAQIIKERLPVIAFCPRS